MSEPAGLSRSLDEIISASQKKPAGGGRGGGRRGGSHAARGGGHGQSLGIAGGVHKQHQQQSNRGGGRGRGSHISRGAHQSRPSIQHNQQRQMPKMPQMPMMPQMPVMQMPTMMGGISSEMEQLQLAEMRLKQRERELLLKEKEILLLQAEQELNKSQGGAALINRGAAPIIAAPRARPAPPAPPAKAPFNTAPKADEDMMDVPEEETCEYVVDKLGSVIVSLQGTTIVTISREGEVMLETGGWWTQETLDGMNRVLKHIGVAVKATGDPEEGSWFVIFRGQSRRMNSDGFKLAAAGGTERRGALVIASFKNTSAEIALGGDSAAVRRRLQNQGRY